VQCFSSPATTSRALRDGGGMDEARAVTQRDGLARASRSPAFDALAAAHYDAVSRFARRLCGNDVEANDLVQDTFERALRKFDTFDADTNARAWLFTIVHNAFIDACRRKSTRVVSECVDVPDPSTVEGPEPPPWTALSERDVRAAIDALQSDFQSVYRMHALEGRSYQEISSELGIPVNTVGTRLSRARSKLKSILTAMTRSSEGTR
jgi:RNA polymerase sigma-70 factor (ECF subfamily)